MDRRKLEALEKNQLIDIILLMTEEIKTLTAKVAELEGRLNTNSRNSSKPPSKDGFDIPTLKSLRTKSDKKPGGQKGHKGVGLKLERAPDEVIEHKAEYCQTCGMDLNGISCICVKTSNVIDFQVEVRIVAHHQMKSICPACGTANTGEMPKEASHSMVYGSGLRAFVVLLSNFACVGMKKNQHDIVECVQSIIVNRNDCEHKCWICQKQCFNFTRNPIKNAKFAVAP